RGPQSTGILCGRRPLIASAALQMLDMDDHFELWEPPASFIDKSKLKGMPRHGIGRGFKVAKEQIAALLTALRLFASGAYDAELPAKRKHLEDIAHALANAPVRCDLIVPADDQSLPLLEIAIDEARLGRSAMEVCRRLRRGKPPVQVGHGQLAQGKLVINPMHLNEERSQVLVRRLKEELASA